LKKHNQFFLTKMQWNFLILITRKKKADRYIMLGLSYKLRIVVVCYCLRKKELEIRIISARKATKKEQKIYFGGKI
jgi:uncharacterized DUF497 family protein